MFSPVEPAYATPPTVGLVASAVTPNDGARWENGFAWRSERCPLARGFDMCAVGEDAFEDPAVGAGDSGIHYYRPVAFRVEDECVTRSGATANDESRVRRQAVGATSFMVARELETGALSQANPFSTPDGPDVVNPYLAMPDGVIVPGIWDPVAGMGMLEQEARQAALGMDVWLHVPVRLIITLGDHLVREGNLLFTRTGARVVADAGYEGSGPEGQTGLWLYATGPVTVRLDEPIVTAQLDHRTNRWLMTADRLFAAAFDPCSLHAIQVTDPAPAP